MRARRGAALALAASLALAPVVHADDEDEPTLAIVGVREEASGLRVSFRVENAFGPDVTERIDSGMTLTFTHRIDLVARRAVPLMPVRLLSRTFVETTARYDTLTRQYYLERRTWREEPEGSGVPPPAETSATTERSEMQAWMTRVNDAPLAGPPTEGTLRKLRVRVRTEMGRRYRLLIFPFDDDVEAEQLLRP